MAKIAGVSHDTVAKVKKIEEIATPEIKVALAKGEISINQAHTQINMRNEDRRDYPKHMIRLRHASPLYYSQAKNPADKSGKLN